MSLERDEQQTCAIFIKRAQALTETYRFKEALEPLRQALVIAPGNFEALCRSSFARLHLGEYGKALDFADRAVRSEPANEWGYRLQGVALLGLGRKAEAMAAAQEAVRLAPDWPSALYVLAGAQIANRRLGEAQRTARRAREIAPEAYESHKVLATVEMTRKSWREAEASLRKALALHPTSYAALNDLGVCLLHQKRADEAVEVFRQASRANPAEENVRENLKIAVERYSPSRGVFAGLLSAPPAIYLVINEGSWFSAGAGLFLFLTTLVILAFSLARLPSLRGGKFKRLTPDVQNFIRAERRRERGYHLARVACGLSAIALLWWIALRILIPASPSFPWTVTGKAVFTALCACFLLSAAGLALRGRSVPAPLRWRLRSHGFRE
jgi:tetratricopeptide (TPR) repeat protein